MNTTAQTELMRCPACGANNRVIRGKANPVCGRCKAPLGGAAGPVVVTDATFAEAVERSPLPVLLDVWAPWCGPCRMVAPIIEELAGELSGKVRVAKLNSDENPRTSARFNVRSIPTLLILQNGREVDRLVGALPKGDILRRLQNVIAL